MEYSDEVLNKYSELLKAILKNAKNLKESSLVLLKRVASEGSNKENQFLATHAQHFMYLSLEEIGKFYLILFKYPTEINDIGLHKIGFYDHNCKVGTLINYLNSIREKKGSPSPYSAKQAVKMFRIFKEPNVYIDYTNGSIICPISNRGKDSLENLAKSVSSSLMLAEFDLRRFENDPSVFLS